jgi:hypothetical protein
MMNISAKERMGTDIKIAPIILGKCKMISQKRVIEISSQNKSVLSVEKDLLSNKICLKGKKLGSSKVSMLLFDGSGIVTWYVQVIQPTRKVKGKRKDLKSGDKTSTFDKDLEISHKLSGWK